MVQSAEQASRTQELWDAYRETRSASAREGLILAYIGLVKYAAGRIAIGLPSYVEVDDLFGAGLLGLMQALDKFEPDRNVKFETYALPRIRGAMLDEMRSQDWFPRSMRKKAKVLEQAYSNVESQLGRSATDNEIARFLKIPLMDYYDLVDEVCLTTLISLDKEIANCSEGLYAILTDDFRWNANPDPSQLLEDKELKGIVKETLETLPEKERIVLTLYYYEELTLKEIGEVLGISESRVCQVHTKAVMRLRGRIIQHTKSVSIQRLSAEVEQAKAKKSVGSDVA